MEDTAANKTEDLSGAISSIGCLLFLGAIIFGGLCGFLLGALP